MFRAIHMVFFCLVSVFAVQSVHASLPHREEVFRPRNATFGEIMKIQGDCYRSVEEMLSAQATSIVQLPTKVRFDGEHFKATVDSYPFAEVLLYVGKNYYDFPKIKMDIPERCRFDGLGRYATDLRCKIDKVTLETENSIVDRVKLVCDNTGMESELAVDASSLIRCMRDGLGRI